MTKIKKITNQPGTRTTYGVYTTAKDGVVYKSQFEAEFVNKFLIPSKMKYEYEKKYHGSNCKCDFYLEDIDLWIECVYHKVELRYNYKFKYGNRVYLNVPYEDRAYVKASKCRWDPEIRKWYVEYTGKSINNLHKYIPNSELETVYVSNGKAITKEYDDNLLEKMHQNKGNILVVLKDDMKYNHLLHLIIAKKNEFVFRKIIEMYFTLFNDPVKLKNRLEQLESKRTDFCGVEQSGSSPAS